MSTKVGISYDRDYYLYKECFEHNSDVYLRLDDAKFAVDLIEGSGTKTTITVKIGIETWRKIVGGWSKDSWSSHPEWDNKREGSDYDEEGIIRFLEEKIKDKNP